MIQSAMPWQQLCGALVAHWWRLPDAYKRELCAIFAVPLAPGNTPLCTPLCDCIRIHHIRLHTCVLYELQRFQRCLLQDGWAHYQLQAQIHGLPNGPAKSVLFGFMLPIDYWLNTKELYQDPWIEATNELFNSYSFVLNSTSHVVIDYLALLSNAPAAASAPAKMRRK